MIAVIADDLTGAAELGGIGLKYSLKVEIATEVEATTNADLLIISADTRSIREEDAVTKVRQITRRILALQPKFIYKKIDSVLRGHVVPELRAQMEAMQLTLALIVPANPHLERTIKDGQYYFKGALIHLSSFSRDPEFPIRSSDVRDMLRTEEVSVIKLDQQLPPSGIAVGEVAKEDDLIAWAGRVNKDMLLVGGAGFFTAILNTMQAQGEGLIQVDQNDLVPPVLYVSGTTFNKSQSAIKQLKTNGGPVSYMPDSIIRSVGSDNDYEEWSIEVVELLSSNGKAIIAIEESASVAFSNNLREKTASIVKKVLQKANVQELVVEGGSTAASIIRELSFTRLIPTQELSAGVIRMKIAGKDHPRLTIKPGSYEWPKDIWYF